MWFGYGREKRDLRREKGGEGLLARVIDEVDHEGLLACGAGDLNARRAAAQARHPINDPHESTTVKQALPFASRPESSKYCAARRGLR